MATASICGSLISGLSADCKAGVRKFYQQACVINKADIDIYTIEDPNTTPGTCAYKVSFELKVGKTGYKFTGPEAGTTFFGSYDKSRSDLGYAQYSHQVGILVSGISEDVNCILDALDKGSYVVALQLTDGTVVIYGFENGLSTGDYSYNVQEGGGGTQIILQSLDTAPERLLPLIYEPATGGDANADFDSCFDNPGP